MATNNSDVTITTDLKVNKSKMKHKHDEVQLQYWDDEDCGQHSIENWEKYLTERLFIFYNNLKKTVCSDIDIEEFMLIRTIGCGSYGTILLATKKDIDRTCVIKVTNKEKLVNSGHINHARDEKKILQSLSFPFVINLITFFQDNSHLYFVMPFVQGGDLFTLMRNVIRLSEDEAKFYSAQIVLALEYLNFIGVMHRDLKPENILLTNRGYLKLADFGLAKILPMTGRAYTFCGSNEYISPEVLGERGYGFSVDWWSLGVLIYEMCSGRSPFSASSTIKTYEKILNGSYHMPVYFSVALKNLILNLLKTDVTKRLGCTWLGVNSIKQASWFQSVSWMELINRQVEPPYVPKVLNVFDDSLFDNFSNHKLSIETTDKYNLEFKDFC